MMLGVVIPTHSRPECLKLALASVAGFPVVVVDDSPSGMDGSVDANVIRTTGEEGFACAVNRGIDHWQQAGFTHVLVLNDDAALEEGAVNCLMTAWTDTDGALAPVVHEPDGPVYGVDLLRGGRVRLRRTPGTVEAVSGAVIMMRCTERFDPSYRHGFEDIDLCCRLRQRGLVVRVVEDARATHAAGGTISRRSRMAQQRALSGHLRWVGGGPRGVYAVALSVAQVLRDGGPMERLFGVLDAVRDHHWRAP